MRLVLWSLLGSLVFGAGVLTGVRAVRNHDHPGAVPFALLAVLLGGVGALIAVALSGLGLIELNTLFEVLLIGGYAFTSILWISFVFEYTGRGPPITWQRGLGLVVLGCLTIASTIVSGLQQTGEIDFGFLGQVSYLSTFGLQMAVFSLGLLGAVLIARSAITYDDFSLGRALLFVSSGIGITVLPLTVAYSQQIGREMTLRLGFLQIGAVLGLFAWTQFRTDPFERGASAGHLARETVLEAMTAPIVVVDRTNRLLDVNHAAEDTFAIETTNLRERSLADVTGTSVSSLHDGSVSLQTASGRREFVVNRTEITDATGDELGLAYRFRDVTDRQTREQRLQVLNRVIRHNLRNDLDAIRGFAEPIRDEDLPADESAQYFEQIATIASNLADIAHTTDRSERVMTESSLQRERCELVELAEAVADASACEQVTVDAREPAVVIQSDRDVIRLVLDELVDNAVAHSDRETPAVDIRIREAESGATLEVRDDGPGIPAAERAVLVDGEETPVKHGSGIGLWMVYWAVTRLGGQLAFRENEPRGSIVVIHLSDLAGSRVARPDT
ncbi:MAG: signal transduction histidine kinase [Haloarculaceae archaeon]|jgi:signal transduction histidine kinase